MEKVNTVVPVPGSHIYRRLLRGLRLKDAAQSQQLRVSKRHLAKDLATVNLRVQPTTGSLLLGQNYNGL